MVQKRSKTKRRTVQAKSKKNSKTKLKSSKTIQFKKDRPLEGYKFNQLNALPWVEGELYGGWFKWASTKKVGSEQRLVYEHFTGAIWSTRDENRQIKVQITANELKRFLIHPELCKGDVDPVYVRGAIQYCTDILVLFYPVAVRNIFTFNCVGFLMGYPKNYIQNKSVFYIDIICVESSKKNPKQSGSYLLDIIEEAMTINGYSEVQLSAIPSVLTYYPRRKYAHRHGCDRPVIVNQSFQNSFAERKKNETIPQSNDEAIELEDYKNYMIFLTKNGFSTGSYVKPDICSPFNSAGHLKTDDEIRNMLFGQTNCQSHGFLMRKCLDSNKNSDIELH